MKSNNYLDKLKNVELEILDEIIRVCEKNNIEYFLIAGTLLGAVRHKGIIPWDDDIDVGMTREYYDKFCSLPKSEFKDKFLLNSFKTNKKCSYPFAKLVMKNTMFIERKNKDAYDKKYSGIWVDIFPLDGLDDPLSIEHEKRKKKFDTYFTLINIKNNTSYYQNSKIKKFIYNKILFFVPIKFLVNKLNKTIMYDKDCKPKYYCSYGGIYILKRETHEYDAIYPLKKVEFEHRKVNGMNDNDKYLKTMYGDYMKLPKEEDRKTHNPYYVKFIDGEEYKFEEE